MHTPTRSFLAHFAHCIAQHSWALSRYRQTRETFWLITVKCYASAAQTWLIHYRHSLR